MPISLDNLDTSIQSVKVYTPKFFDKILTGKGKTTGLLNETRNPIFIPVKTLTQDENINTSRRKITNGNTTTNFIPVNPLTARAWEDMKLIKKPMHTTFVKIAEHKTAKISVELCVPVHSLVFEETVTAASKSKKLTACYQLMLFYTKDGSTTKYARVEYPTPASIFMSNTYYSSFTCNPMPMLDTITGSLANDGFEIDNQNIIDFFSNYSLYDGVVNRAEEWNTTIDSVLDEYFANVSANKQTSLTNVMHVVRRLETYNIPLELYRNIYNSITTHFPNDDDSTVLCKQNLNLLLSDTLNNLDKNKSLLTSLPAPSKPVVMPSLNKFSIEQRKAVTTTDPLVMVQAGAGTGKSTTILGRIEYMIASGIDPNDITVLSFTNAAADHIRDKNPGVHSMTIASMIHSIYSLNFPDHELSNLDTVINSLMIYYPKNDFAEKFRKKLLGIKKNDRDSFTSMNNFIEQNYDEIINMLNTLKQTSLELEIIICYQQIDKFIEPAEITSKYLIIDEVQDNSIFEFIYTLKYVDKHKESLFIVGRL